jgi:DNA polymerase/3'-5' exonuclease PolX
MFSKFHVFVLSGGPLLGNLQSDLLRNIITEHGGVVEHDPLALSVVAASLARRGRKKLVVVSGRDSVEQIELDLLQSAVALALTRGAVSDNAATRAADMVRQLRALTCVTETTTTPSVKGNAFAAIPPVSFVSHLWISTAASRGRSAAPEEASSIVAGLVTSFRVSSATGATGDCGELHQTAVVVPSLNAARAPADEAEDAKPSELQKSSFNVAADALRMSVVPTRSIGGRGAGFLPVFFAPTTSHSDSDGNPSGDSAMHRDREYAINQLHRQGKSMGTVNSGGEQRGDAGQNMKRSRSISPPHLDRHRSEHRRTDQARPGNSDGPTWLCATDDVPQSTREGNGDRSPEIQRRTRIVIDPNDQLLRRQAAYIDDVKPFICQQQTPRGVARLPPQSYQSASLFADDVDDNDGAALGEEEEEEEYDAAVLGIQGAATQSAFPTAAPEAPRVALNQPLLSQLAELKSVYDATGDQWRMYAYNKAIGIIKRLPFEVQRAEQLASYQGLGHRILNKIREILNTGTTTKLNVLRTTPHVAAMEAFSKIWGVGPSTARRLSTYSSDGGNTRGGAPSSLAVAGPSTQQLRTISDLRACSELQHLLNPQQLVGLRHYEDLDERMPRDEVTALIDFVRGALKSVVGETRAANIEVIACGSYRRRKATSGDVDILLCDRNRDGSCSSTDGLLGRLVQHLKRPFQSLTEGSKTLVLHENAAEVDRQQQQVVVKKGGDAANHSSAHSVLCRCSRRQHAFIVEDLTVSHRGLQAVHSDSWFGVVQLPDCNNSSQDPRSLAMKGEFKHAAVVGVAPQQCRCVHRKLIHKNDDVEVVGAQPSVGEAYTCGSHYSRRMDIKCYPPEQFAFALLYFTGSDYFNRSMRLYCQKRGWSLSDKDLKPVVRVRGEKVHETAHGVPCKSERDIFEAIGLPYKEPWERDV